MEQLKLRIGKDKDLILFGHYKNAKVWQVVQHEKIKRNFWKSYFVIQKNNKKKRVISTPKKMELAKQFESEITLVALKLAENVDIINYIGILNGYLLWEAWMEDALDQRDSVYILYNYSAYVVIRDKKIIEEIKAYLVLQK